VNTTTAIVLVGVAALLLSSRSEARAPAAPPSAPRQPVNREDERVADWVELVRVVGGAVSDVATAVNRGR
jgi:hypothetical protein